MQALASGQRRVRMDSSWALADQPPHPDELGLLVAVHPGALASVDGRLLEPQAQRLGGAAEITRHLGARETMGVDAIHGTGTELRAIEE